MTIELSLFDPGLKPGLSRHTSVMTLSRRGFVALLASTGFLPRGSVETTDQTAEYGTGYGMQYAGADQQRGQCPARPGGE